MASNPPKVQVKEKPKDWQTMLQEWLEENEPVKIEPNEEKTESLYTSQKMYFSDIRWVKNSDSYQTL